MLQFCSIMEMIKQALVINTTDLFSEFLLHSST